MKKLSIVLALILLASMLLTACSSGASKETASAEGAVKICQVTDTGGIDDKSFNALAWSGMERAATDFGVEVKYLESQQQSDYEVNINAFIEEGCDLIISVGYLLADATAAVLRIAAF